MQSRQVRLNDIHGSRSSVTKYRILSCIWLLYSHLDNNKCYKHALFYDILYVVCHLSFAGCQLHSIIVFTATGFCC